MKKRAIKLNGKVVEKENNLEVKKKQNLYPSLISQIYAANLFFLVFR